MSMIRMNRRNTANHTAAKDICEFNLTSGIDSLNAVNVVKEKNYTVPFTMRCLFDAREDSRRYNVRFVRTGLTMKDTKGVVHGMVAEIVPLISAEDASALKLDDEGTLIIRVADVPRVWMTEPFTDKYGRLTGDYRIKCVCSPKFISFTPISAVSVTVSE